MPQWADWWEERYSAPSSAPLAVVPVDGTDVRDAGTESATILPEATTTANGRRRAPCLPGAGIAASTASAAAEDNGTARSSETHGPSASGVPGRSDGNGTTEAESCFWSLPKPLRFIESFFREMGACLSRATGAAMVIEAADGGEEEYHQRYIEDRVLGEGEFGVVHLVYDMREAAPDQPGAAASNGLACKSLRKGVVFKDNTFYTPLKPETLQAEVNILRKLAGGHYCLALKGVYETNRVILMITEFCAGGEMMEYVSKQEKDLRTEDVSRISFQLIDALAHCERHDVIHRDIKPENIMFMHSSPGSELRVIDFGSGTDIVADEGIHTTFAGSAFYTSPEMFQRKYTIKTDVWSAGVTLYVLVAGYPADVLQKAFNILQSDEERSLRELPNMPADLPDSYFDMIEAMLVYRHKKRKQASDVLGFEFVQFHKTPAHGGAGTPGLVAEATDKVGDELPDKTDRPRRTRTHSISIRGSVGRHSMFLDYQKFERSLTTLLATMLDKHGLAELLIGVEKRHEGPQTDDGETKAGETTKQTHARRLEVVEVNELKELLQEQDQTQVLSMLEKLPNVDGYSKFAYHVNLLREFCQDYNKGSSPSTRRRGSFRGNGAKVVRDSSIRSAGSMRGNRSRAFGSVNLGNVNSSVHGGGNVFQEWKKRGSNGSVRKSKMVRSRSMVK